LGTICPCSSKSEPPKYSPQHPTKRIFKSIKTFVLTLNFWETFGIHLLHIGMHQMTKLTLSMYNVDL
jgi:hypothetical protein